MVLVETFMCRYWGEYHSDFKTWIHIGSRVSILQQPKKDGLANYIDSRVTSFIKADIDMLQHKY
jgi:hypothetical protein